MKTTSLDLIDEEIAVLDGKVRPEIQTAVNQAKERIDMLESFSHLPENLAGACTAICQKAMKAGDFREIYRGRDLSYMCKYCGKKAEYQRYKRDTNWNRKGDINHKKPMMKVSGVLVGGVSICNTCWEPVKAAVGQYLKDKPIQLPPWIVKESKWKKYDNVKCTECGWEGHEGQMGREFCLLGPGTYPAICPSCKAINLALGPRPIERTGTFTMVEVQQ